MSDDHDNAAASGLYAAAEVSRILHEAVVRGQQFQVDIRAGMRPNGTAEGKGRKQFDGGYEISISVEPLGQEGSPPPKRRRGKREPAPL